MREYLTCPSPRCRYTVTASEQAVEQMTDHITTAHELPEISASFHASTLRAERDYQAA
ncbi:hypothetical protein [Streptomyces wuyuanensis]|uniref:DUF1059 domain-containing protein n=1 Tax=Streptomyces wuyuanensis TaxID=1196353 RepID=A0A1G9ZBY2_9ACTN|nr:hypothetical protein [Streptomyces wuyuanensis]SDN18839.1 hypothetical protein SAMN05444921_12176 [Streptomyces wuyuanensis]